MLTEWLADLDRSLTLIADEIAAMSLALTSHRSPKTDEDFVRLLEWRRRVFLLDGHAIDDDHCQGAAESTAARLHLGAVAKFALRDLLRWMEQVFTEGARSGKYPSLVAAPLEWGNSLRDPETNERVLHHGRLVLVPVQYTEGLGSRPLAWYGAAHAQERSKVWRDRCDRLSAKEDQQRKYAMEQAEQRRAERDQKTDRERIAELELRVKQLQSQQLQPANT